MKTTRSTSHRKSTPDSNSPWQLEVPAAQFAKNIEVLLERKKRVSAAKPANPFEGLAEAIQRNRPELTLRSIEAELKALGFL